jgi:glutamate racemase
MAPPPPPPTIGVFDSGFGGLTVLRALVGLMPEANYIYLGDTARLPYGSKSHETIARYAVSSAKFLAEQGAELLVVACNTATALALEDIQRAIPIPVIGVVEPGAQAALAASTSISANPAKTPVILTLSERSESMGKNPRIWLEAPPMSPPTHVLVLATTATVQSHAYTRALNALNIDVHEKACPLLVPLVEEGWIDHPVTDEVLRIYLTEALAEAPAANTLLLGCTHYPLLEPAIRRALAALNRPLTIIDSAQATAHAVVTHFAFNSTKNASMARTVANGIALQARNTKPEAKNCRFYATDSIEKFERLGSAFLGQPVTGVQPVDLGE